MPRRPQTAPSTLFLTRPDTCGVDCDGFYFPANNGCRAAKREPPDYQKTLAFALGIMYNIRVRKKRRAKCAGMMELADVPDSKSGGGDTVRVRPPLPAPKSCRPFGRIFFVGLKSVKKCESGRTKSARFEQVKTDGFDVQAGFYGNSGALILLNEIIIRRMCYRPKHILFYDHYHIIFEN